MKKFTLFYITLIFLVNTNAIAAEKERNLFQKLFCSENDQHAVCQTSNSRDIVTEERDESIQDASLKKERTFFQKLFCSENDQHAVCQGSRKKNSFKNKQVKKETNKKNKFFSNNDNTGQNISVYTGTFDVIDKEGDDQTTLLGIEHKNEDLFRDTWIGRLSPTTGGFVTGKSSVYLYTGIEADYNLGPINISPSFAPGYYQAGDGKNLGSALEFKSEVKIGIDLFKNSNLGYSYSHISNNDWGDTNPGTDNQSINFSKKF